MKLSTTFAMTALVAMLGAGASFAQTAATPAKPVMPAKPAVTAPAAPMAMDKAAVSKKCSADADAKGLHGKDRKKFREACKADAMKK